MNNMWLFIHHSSDKIVEILCSWAMQWKPIKQHVSRKKKNRSQSNKYSTLKFYCIKEDLALQTQESFALITVYKFEVLFCSAAECCCYGLLLSWWIVILKLMLTGSPPSMYKIGKHLMRFNSPRCKLAAGLSPSGGIKWCHNKEELGEQFAIIDFLLIIKKREWQIPESCEIVKLEMVKI